MTNLFAYTSSAANYPDFISVNRRDDGGIEIIIRSAAREDGSCGDTVCVVLTPEQVAELKRNL